MLDVQISLIYIKTSPQAKRHKLSLLRLFQLSSTNNFQRQTTLINRLLSSIDNFHPIDNFHQMRTFINRQLSSTTFINQQLSSKDNFHQQTNFIKRQLSSIDNFHQQTTFINRQPSPLTRVTSVKSLEGILTHQSHINQVSRRNPHLPESHQSSLL